MSFIEKNSWHLCSIWEFHLIRPKTGENWSQNLVQTSIQIKTRLRMRLRPVLSVQTAPIGPFPGFPPPDPLGQPHLKAARPCSTSKTHIAACVLQGIAAPWLSAHYKDIARIIARAMAGGLGFVTPCPNKQGKNSYFSKVSDASGTASDVANVRKDCKHFGPPLWVVLVEERGPFGGPS